MKMDRKQCMYTRAEVEELLLRHENELREKFESEPTPEWWVLPVFLLFLIGLAAIGATLPV